VPARPLSVVQPVIASDDSWADVIRPEPATEPAAQGLPGADDASAMQLAPFGVLELTDDPAFAILSANPAAELLLGRALTRGQDLRAASSMLAGMVAFHRAADGATFEVEVEGRTLAATMRRAGGGLLVYLTVTDETASRLRRAIATAAHEIRTPVTVIYGAAETLQLNLDRMDDDRRERLLASVARQARVLDTITADLLTAAQIQRGTLRVQLELVDPRSVVEQVVTDRFDVSVEIDDGRCVQADPIRLEQMLANLLTNALKYGAAPFSVRVRPDEDHVAIEVSDAGAGVPEDFRDRLFQEFSRASGTTAKGTGLGLYVVRTLAEAQGGRVTYAPREGGGSVFSISLPARD
jgi:signal transduction histidine kinase